MTSSVRMFSRRRCGLCDQARTVIEEVRRSARFGFEEIFIDGDDRLERDYGLRVPVVLVDGEERFEVEIDPDDLRRALAGA